MIVDKNNFDIKLFHNAQVSTIESTHSGPKRLAHLKESLNYIDIDGAVLEFGVFSGLTINLISNTLSNDIVHGFDSFEGLPENWFLTKTEKKLGIAKRHKGYFAVDTLPKVNNNVKLWKGWFDTTIPDYIKTNKSNIKFLHIDCDLYSSTTTVFNLLNDYIVCGTVIVFDEFYPWNKKSYDLWHEHEYKALKEWVEKTNRSFKILSRNDFQQCAIKII